MGNINDYALPQIKRIFNDTGSSNDTVYLEFLRQSADEIDGDTWSVAVDGSSYTLSPDPGVLSSFWNAMARCGVWMYRRDALNTFIDELEGMATLKDSVTAVSRATTMRVKLEMMRDARKDYLAALRVYKKSALSGGGGAIDEIAEAESTT